MVYSDGRVAGTLFLIAVFQFIIGVIVAEAMTEGYSVSYNYLSDLGVGPYSLIFNVSIFLLGLLTIAGSYLLQRTVRIWILAVPLALMSIGAMGAGVFPEKAVHVSTIMHDASAVLFLLFGALSATASYRLLKMPLSVINLALGLTSLTAVILFVSDAYLQLGQGGMQRLIVYPFLIAQIGTGAYLTAQQQKQTNQHQK